jgi:hypothetical protein
MQSRFGMCVRQVGTQIRLEATAEEVLCTNMTSCYAGARRSKVVLDTMVCVTCKGE